MSNKCWGGMGKCQGSPKYIAVIPEAPGSDYFDKSVWCEDCMGESFRDSNPYLKLMKGGSDGNSN